MKKEKIFIRCLIIGIFIVLVNTSYLKGKGIPSNMKDYIGYDYDNLPRNLKSSGIDVKLTEDNQVIEILINRRGFAVDSIQIGDSIDRVYEIYPADWISTRKHTIQILYGKENHYGVATDYIIYTISKDRQVQSILFGKTTPFLKYDLAESNQVTKELLQGEWISKTGHKLTFDLYTHRDNYLDALWDKQGYIILSPNSLIIYRQQDNRSEKVKLYFWIVDKKLYLFTINEEGKPIKESIEVFIKL